MKNLIYSLILCIGFSFSAYGKDAFRLIHVQDLASLMEQKGAKLAIYDVNNEKVRNESGVIPGAKLLTSSKDFDPITTLPARKDTKLVFYCANPQCMASHNAAKVAVKNGYTNVSVLSDGIQGWVKAGKPVGRP